jgi:apolipoprotein N-acyltransferase
MSEIQQLQKLLTLADSLADDSTDYFVCPETALPRGLWYKNGLFYKSKKGNAIPHTDKQWSKFMKRPANLDSIRNFLNKYPKAKFVIGLISYKKFEKGEKHSETARNIKNTQIYYDAFNSALCLDTTYNSYQPVDEANSVQIYHKSQLLLGPEKMPFPRFLKFLKFLTIDLGGVVGSLGSQEECSVFSSSNDSTKIAPVICWESVFGEYVTEYVKKGANFIFVITNDGWWGDTPGYRQHLNFSRLRAIETRRSIARSANTGVSCFINQKGELLQQTSWWVATSIKAKINANTKLTYYTIHGDYIGRIAGFLSVLFLLYSLVQLIIARKKLN